MPITTSTSTESEMAKVPSQVSTNTLLGNLIGKVCATNQNITIPEYGTINRALEILMAESVGVKSGRDFELKYFMVGRRGNRVKSTSEDGVVEMEANQHQPVDANLFSPMPFVARPLTNPLTEAQRKNLRCRTVENFGGVSYEFWWVKLANFDEYNPRMLKIIRDPETGIETPTTFIPTDENLFPTPINLTSENTVPVSNTYVNATAMLDCSLNANDVVELQNVAAIRYGDAGKARISETAVCWGIDTLTEGNIGTGVMTYTEAVAVVPAHFVSESDARNANNNTGISLVFDHGVSEPMLLHTVV